MILRAGLLLYAIPAVLVLVALAYVAGRCTAPDEPEPGDDEFTPGVIDSADVIDFEPDPEPGFIDRIIYRDVPVYRQGQAAIDTAKVNEYIRRALAAADSSIPASEKPDPIYPLLNIETGKESGIKIGLQRSDGMFVVRDFPGCKHPCRAGASDTLIYARTNRISPRFEFLKDVAVCGAVAGAGAGVAVLAKYDRPEYVAAGALGACAFVQLTN